MASQRRLRRTPPCVTKGVKSTPWPVKKGSLIGGFVTCGYFGVVPNGRLGLIVACTVEIVRPLHLFTLTGNTAHHSVYS